MAEQGEAAFTHQREVAARTARQHEVLVKLQQEVLALQQQQQAQSSDTAKQNIELAKQQLALEAQRVREQGDFQKAMLALMARGKQ